MIILSKSKLLNLLQCPKRLWLEQYRSELAVTEDDVQARMDAGSRAGEIARGLFPGGVLVEGQSMEEYIRRTGELLASHSGPLYEATFQHNNVRVMADILLPESGGFRLVEVKSATSIKDYHLWDAAIQTWVLQNAGLELRGIELAVIDSGFVYPGNGDYHGLFIRKDVCREARALLPEVPGWVAQGFAVLASNEEPVQTPGDQCETPFSCPFWDYCAPETTEYPVESLPYIGSQAEVLRAQGLRDIRDVPDSVPLSTKQRRVRDVTKSGRAVLSVEAGVVINNLPWPRWYMDFETIDFAVPEWAGTRPYQQIPFQWSCHVEAADGSLRHAAFLADDVADPRRAFAESLIPAMSGAGPVLAYNAGFEKSILHATAAAFPDLAGELHAIAARLFDLLPLARKHYYHPEMRGSWSLKSVLPTVAPELSYAELSVSHGEEAQSAFLEMLAMEKGSADRGTLRRCLLEYCERDTYALVVLTRFFAGKT
ncbi:MAG: DUF2779 domain-containing protein [Desulfovibrionaceae bacterium]|nr:DUF2779 domain-containing protein [Desulfovibrionaceae bacterium]